MEGGGGTVSSRRRSRSPRAKDGHYMHADAFPSRVYNLYKSYASMGIYAGPVRRPEELNAYTAEWIGPPILAEYRKREVFLNDDELQKQKSASLTALLNLGKEYAGAETTKTWPVNYTTEEIQEMPSSRYVEDDGKMCAGETMDVYVDIISEYPVYVFQAGTLLVHKLNYMSPNSCDSAIDWGGTRSINELDRLQWPAWFFLGLDDHTRARLMHPESDELTEYFILTRPIMLPMIPGWSSDEMPTKFGATSDTEVGKRDVKRPEHRLNKMIYDLGYAGLWNATDYDEVMLTRPLSVGAIVPAHKLRALLVLKEDYENWMLEDALDDYLDWPDPPPPEVTVARDAVMDSESSAQFHLLLM